MTKKYEFIHENQKGEISKISFADVFLETLSIEHLLGVYCPIVLPKRTITAGNWARITLLTATG